jgi:hypothetical protein
LAARFLRTHLALAKDTPEPRAVQPPEQGAVAELREVGDLHHRYERLSHFTLFSHHSTVQQLLSLRKILVPEPIDSHLSFEKTAKTGFFRDEMEHRRGINQEIFHH